jgi:hypothetical protein
VRRVLSIVLVALLVLPAWATNSNTDSVIIGDDFEDLLTTDALGTTLTTAIMIAGLHKSAGSTDDWTCNPSPATGMTIAAPRVARYNNSVIVRKDAEYFRSRPRRAIKYDNANSNTTCQLNQDDTKHTITVMCYITLGVPDQGVNNHLWDLIYISSLNNGWLAVVQLQSGNPYTLRIEENHGSTTHSPNIIVTPGQTYWVCIRADYNGVASSKAQLAAYTVDGRLVGPIVSVAQNTSTSDVVDRVLFGNNETGTASGTSNYFEDIIADSVGAQFPIGPGVREIALWKAPAAGNTVVRRNPTIF